MRTLPCRLALLLPLICATSALAQESQESDPPVAAAGHDEYFDPMYDDASERPRYSPPASRFDPRARQAAGETELRTQDRAPRLTPVPEYAGQAAQYTTPLGTRHFHITAKIVEFDASGKEFVVGEPTLTTAEGLRASVSLHGYKSVHLGGDVSITVPTVNISVPGGDGDEQLELGRSLRVKLIGREHGRIRMDASVESRELEAVENGIRVRDHSVRAIETIRLGQPVTLVLDKDAHGAARSWIELTVRDGDEPVARRRAPVLPGPYDPPAYDPATVRRAPVRRSLR